MIFGDVFNNLITVVVIVGFGWIIYRRLSPGNRGKIDDIIK